MLFTTHKDLMKIDIWEVGLKRMSPLYLSHLFIETRGGHECLIKPLTVITARAYYFSALCHNAHG